MPPMAMALLLDNTWATHHGLYKSVVAVLEVPEACESMDEPIAADSRELEEGKPPAGVLVGAPVESAGQ